MLMKVGQRCNSGAKIFSGKSGSEMLMTLGWKIDGNVDGRYGIDD
jgi:hypothetical protein